MKKMNPVVHFEMPARNSKRMANFYTKVFSWQTQVMGADMGNYVVVSTAEADEKGRPKMPGAINGGFYPRKEEADKPSVVIAVDNIGDSIKQITEAGGNVLAEPVEIPGVGKYASFIDTEGNLVSILQPKI